MGAGRHWLEHRHYRVGAIVLAWLLAASPTSAAELAGKTAPDFALKSFTGENLRLSEYRGGIVLLTLWASWCGECREQLSGLQQLHDQYGEQGLAVLSVSVDSKPRRAQELVAGLGLDYPVLLDSDKQVARLYDPRFMPLTVLIDPAGTVRYVHEGFTRSDTEIYAAEVEQLLVAYGPATNEG